MTCPKSVRIAAIVSQAVLILWGLLQLLLSIFQKKIMLQSSIGLSESDLEAVGKINLWTVYALTAAALVFTAVNLMMCMEKCRITPLIISAVTTGLLPFVVTYLFSVQLERYTEGILNDIYSVVAALQVYSSLVNLLSRLLYAAAIITIAAAAVYAYAKKSVTEYKPIERQDFAPPYNIN